MSAVLVAVVVAVTTLGALLARHKENDDVRRERQATVQNTQAQLNDGFTRTAAILATADALVDGDGTIDVARLEVFSRVLLAPGGPASALAYEPVVTAAGRAAFEARTGITITDRTADGRGFVRAADRDVYYPVMATEPTTDRTKQILGFDIAQDPGRGDATRRAIVTGRAQLTGVVPLAPSGRPGFLIVQPLVSGGRVVGFLTVGYLAEDAGRSVLATLPVGTDLRVRDAGVVLYDSGDVSGSRITGRAELGGRTWDLEVDQPLDASRNLSALVLALGLGIAALIAVEAEVSHRNERALVTGRHQLERERDLATGLAAAATTLDVAERAAALIPAVVGARVVRVGLRTGEGHMLPMLDPVAGEPTTRADTVRGIERELEAGRAVFVRDAGDLARALPDATAGAVWTSGSFAFLPIVVGAEPLGALGLGFDDRQPFDSAQTRRLREITTMVAGALERAHLHDTHAHVALTLQRDLLPGSLPTFEPFELSATYHPADLSLVGGDWYDAFEVSEGRLAVVVGDVAGNGIRAAASMGKIRHVIRACAGAYAEPGEVLERANLLISRANPHLFATACYLTIDRDGHGRVAAAGHLPGLVVRKDGVELLVTETGPPLGVREHGIFRDRSFRLDPGDSLVLYTDGLVERRHEALDDSLARLVGIARDRGPWTTAADVLASSDDLGGRDDVVVLLLRRQPADEPRRDAPRQAIDEPDRPRDDEEAPVP